MKKNITKVIYTDNPYDFNEEEIRDFLIYDEENEDPSEDDCWEAWRNQCEIEWDDVSYEAKKRGRYFHHCWYFGSLEWKFQRKLYG